MISNFCNEKSARLQYLAYRLRVGAGDSVRMKPAHKTHDHISLPMSIDFLLENKHNIEEAI